MVTYYHDLLSIKEKNFIPTKEDPKGIPMMNRTLRFIKMGHFICLILMYFVHHMPTFSLVLKGFGPNSKIKAVVDYKKDHSFIEIATNFIAV
jgi:hypothetical protein